jgi:NAD dependent epimerase/dehydratase family enzyme
MTNKLKKKITRFDLGGTVGCGTQGFSWLHIDDMDALFIEAIENSIYDGYICCFCTKSSIQ